MRITDTRYRQWLAGLLLALLFCLPARAGESETPAPTPVTLRHAGSDPVGLALAAAVSDGLQGSPDFRTAADDGRPRIVLILATVDGSVEDPGKQTASSINVLYDADTLPLNGYLITGLVQVCGLTKAGDCAQEILATVAVALARLRVTHPELWGTLQRAT